jgi:hypothetical protein
MYIRITLQYISDYIYFIKNVIIYRMNMTLIICMCVINKSRKTVDSVYILPVSEVRSILCLATDLCNVTVYLVY